MREIKFRGKREGAKAWVYGYVFKTHKANPWSDETTCIFNEDGKFKVEPETVVQYTGKKDKKGIEIYENDNLRWYPQNPKNHTDIIVLWDECNARFNFGGWYEGEFPDTEKDSLVIGTIYENPELLGPHT